MPAPYDLQSAQFFNNPYPTFARMRRDDPVYWNEELNVFMVSRFPDVHALARIPNTTPERVDAFFRNLTNPDPDKNSAVHRMLCNWLDVCDWLVSSRPPGYSWLRELVAQAFSPEMPSPEADIRNLTGQVLNNLTDAPEIEVVDEIGGAMASEILSVTLGLSPADFSRLQQWTYDILNVASWTGNPDQTIAKAYEAICELGAYVSALPGLDSTELHQALADAKQHGLSLSTQELISTCTVLLIGGHEATTKLIANSLLALLRHPDQMARLRAEPSLLRSAVQESMRYESVAMHTFRIATADLTLPSGTIPAGSVILGLIPAASHDDSVYTDPECLDITRQHPQHDDLGQAPHICAAWAMAHTEGLTILHEILQRFPALHLAAHDITYPRDMNLRSPHTLYITRSASL
ncbi:cytochrome P450 [Streptomyces collinus]|uniref:cytochrome P450 n=1 Tax=Streptomyces collinus TaxID=42684 RepID=UPI00367580A0